MPPETEAGPTAFPAGFERAAASDSPILILGEPGSGRSFLARACHRHSARAAGPLVEVDPGAIPAALIESELFGHRAGAFTGAERANPGRVARAAGGSLLFDHLEDLPLAAQPKLLRLVADRAYAPLGGEEQRADVRFLAIGAADLPERAERGVFRSDLLYRLNVLPFHLRPLRERRDELPAWIDLLLADLAERLGRGKPSLSAGARAWMMDYGWPGNLREVRNVLERALVAGGASEEALDPPAPAGLTGGQPRPLREVEAAEIRRALAYTRGRQGKAAALLGISRKALWEKRKRLGIP